MNGELMVCEGCLSRTAELLLVWVHDDPDEGVFCCWGCGGNAVRHHGAEIREVLPTTWRVRT